MALLNQRIAELEKKFVKAFPIVVRFVCKGATPTPEEQARIDEAERLGQFVIVRLIISHHNNFIGGN